MYSDGVSTVVDRLVNIDITIADFQVETTIWIGAYPGFVLNGCALTAEIRKGDQITGFAFLTLGINIGFH